MDGKILLKVQCVPTRGRTLRGMAMNAFVTMSLSCSKDAASRPLRTPRIQKRLNRKKARDKERKQDIMGNRIRDEETNDKKRTGDYEVEKKGLAKQKGYGKKRKWREKDLGK